MCTQIPALLATKRRHNEGQSKTCGAQSSTFDIAKNHYNFSKKVWQNALETKNSVLFRYICFSSIGRMKM